MPRFIDENRNRRNFPEREQFMYDGLLFAEGLSHETRVAIEELSDKFTPKIIGDMIELSYTGKDTGRWYVSLLRQLASILVQADGEIRCEISVDGGADPIFEFYRVQDGLLLRQPGTIVRGKTETVL